MATALITELDAINQMFATIGEAPINTLNGQHPHTTIARSTLSFKLKEFLLKGWSFNSETEVEYSLDANNNIIIGSDILKIETHSRLYKFRLVPRKNGNVHMVYDTQKQSFDLSLGGFSTIKFNRTLALDFDGIPFSAQNYVTLSAARKFQNKVLSSDVVYRLSKEEEFDAYNAFLEEEYDRANHNMLTDNRGVYYQRQGAWV